MKGRAIYRVTRTGGGGGRFSSYEKLVAVGLAILAVASPLYIDRRRAADKEEEEEQVGIINLASCFPIVLVVLMLAICLSRCLERSLARFDPGWIFRVGGSSVGIILLLTLLAFILKCKSSSA
ncbi:uncharacterized protein LOC127813456 [Diospyros lotus]|uniref:uncharacterized protein LOC127813456 n=1 Tax=Diospyros lotus TaxID=55363 RepID=UPI0022573112|nr:uncharacterized protein LOC127813456 [Diospyros lotus]